MAGTASPHRSATGRGADWCLGSSPPKQPCGALSLHPLWSARMSQNRNPGWNPQNSQNSGSRVRWSSVDRSQVLARCAANRHENSAALLLKVSIMKVAISRFFGSGFGDFGSSSIGMPEVFARSLGCKTRHHRRQSPLAYPTRFLFPRLHFLH